MATPKATLTLWKDVVVNDVFGEMVENNAGKYFAWNGEQRDPTVIIANWAIAFLYEDASLNSCGTVPLLQMDWYSKVSLLTISGPPDF